MTINFILVNNFHDFIIENINFYDFIISENENKIYIEASEEEINFIKENLNQFFKGLKIEIEIRNPEYIILKFEDNIKYYPNDY